MENQTTVNINKKILWMFLGIILIIAGILALNYFRIISLPTNLPLVSKLPVSKPVPGSCKILEEKYCDKLEKINILINNTNYTYLVIKDLPPQTPIYSPKNGFLIIGKESMIEFSGYDIGIYLPNFINPMQKIEIRGNFILPSILQRSTNYSDVIAYTSLPKTYNQKYNIMFTITKKTQDGPATDEDALKKLAPKAFKSIN